MLPNEIILNLLPFSCKDLRKYINDCLAIVILFPYIEPDLSIKNIKLPFISSLIGFEISFSIFGICLLNKNFQLFYSLYGKVKDPKIFDHKIFEDYKINNFNGGKIGLDKSKKGETLYDFLNKNNIEKNQNILLLL